MHARICAPHMIAPQHARATTRVRVYARLQKRETVHAHCRPTRRESTHHFESTEKLENGQRTATTRNRGCPSNVPPLSPSVSGGEREGRASVEGWLSWSTAGRAPVSPFSLLPAVHTSMRVTRITRTSTMITPP
jgi:hypothetical protein